MYPIDTTNPSYYRAHQYKNQLDLPNSAFKNRQMQQFYSQIPQGKQYFDQSNKKHFATKFNRSQIEQNNVLNQQYTEQQQQRSRIAMQKSYFKSLNVDDIEGAKPNTLISKAVKNRQKAMSMMKKQEQYPHMSKSSVHGQKNKIYSVFPHLEVNDMNNNNIQENKSLVYKQSEAMNKYSKNKSILQNNSMRILSSYNNVNSYSNNIRNPQTNENTNNYKNGSITSDIIQNNNQKRNDKQINNFHFKNLQQLKVQTNLSNRNQPNIKKITLQQQGKILQRELLQKEKRIKQLEIQLSKQNYSNYQNYTNNTNYYNNQNYTEDKHKNYKFQYENDYTQKAPYKRNQELQPNTRIYNNENNINFKNNNPLQNTYQQPYHQNKQKTKQQNIKKFHSQTGGQQYVNNQQYINNQQYNDGDYEQYSNNNKKYNNNQQYNNATNYNNNVNSYQQNKANRLNDKQMINKIKYPQISNKQIPYNYPKINSLNQNANKMNPSSNIINQNIDRSNIRKYNPTYLSYQSQRIKTNINPYINKYQQH